jgi:hypothetical protein
MRAEFLSNKPAFSSPKTAQQALDEWVQEYNVERRFLGLVDLLCDVA